MVHCVVTSVVLSVNNLVDVVLVMVDTSVTLMTVELFVAKVSDTVVVTVSMVKKEIWRVVNTFKVVLEVIDSIPVRAVVKRRVS